MALKLKPLQFLARSSYRQRRLRDVAGMLPIIGILLLQVPLLWPRAEGQSLTTSAMIYVFGIWILLIALALYLSKAIRNDAPELVEGQEDVD